MKRTGTAKRHKIKQVLTTLLVFAVLVGVVPTVTVSASVPADIIPPLHVLLPHMGATAGQPFRIGAEAFRNHLQKNIAENTGNPQIKIDGNRALYTLRSNNAIQIGEYIFPYFDFGRRLDFQAPHPIGYIVPFLISNGDLFLESVNNNSGASTIIYAGYRLTVNTSFSFTGLNASTSTSISTSRNVFLFSTVIRAGEFNTNAITEYFSSTNEILRRTVGSNTEWLNVTQLLRNDIAQGQLSSVNNAKLSVSQLTATRQVEYGTKAFSIPRDFVTRCGLTFWQYIRTLEPHALYTQSPENSEHELVLPDWLRELLEKLGERDEIEFIICPDGGGVTYNITNNYGGGSSHGGDCCCCEPLQEQTRLLRQIRDYIYLIMNIIAGLVGLEIADGILNVPLNIADRIWDGISGVGGRVWDTVFGDDGVNLRSIERSLRNIERLLHGIDSCSDNDCNCCANDDEQGAFGKILDAILGIPKSILDGLKSLIVPRDGFFNEKISDLQNEFYIKIPIIRQANDLLVDFISILENSSNGTPQLTTGTPQLTIEGELFGVQLDESNNVINFEPFKPFLPLLHGIIIAFSYIAFAQRTRKRLPKLIGGI
jgi:hypothetical protein